MQREPPGLYLVGAGVGDKGLDKHLAQCVGIHLGGVRRVARSVARNIDNAVMFLGKEIHAWLSDLFGRCFLTSGRDLSQGPYTLDLLRLGRNTQDRSG